MQEYRGKVGRGQREDRRWSRDRGSERYLSYKELLPKIALKIAPGGSK